MAKRYHVNSYPWFILIKKTVKTFIVEGANVKELQESIRLNVDYYYDDEQFENSESSSEVTSPPIDHNHSTTISPLDSDEDKRMQDISTHGHVESNTQNITNSETTLNMHDEEPEWTTQNSTSSQKPNCSNNSKFTKLTILLVIFNMIFMI